MLYTLQGFRLFFARHPTPTTMTAKELTAHIRNRIKVAGIAAHCRKYTSCGYDWIRVSVTAHDKNFTADEQLRIKMIAQVNKLTMAQGLPINMENATNPQEFHFLIP